MFQPHRLCLFFTISGDFHLSGDSRPSSAVLSKPSSGRFGWKTRAVHRPVFDAGVRRECETPWAKLVMRLEGVIWSYLIFLSNHERPGANITTVAWNPCCVFEATHRVNKIQSLGRKRTTIGPPWTTNLLLLCHCSTCCFKQISHRGYTQLHRVVEGNLPVFLTSCGLIMNIDIQHNLQL